eukprot:scaffold3632_cov162-Amphora_coffeaeformis.AAC.19
MSSAYCVCLLIEERRHLVESPSETNRKLHSSFLAERDTWSLFNYRPCPRPLDFFSAAAAAAAAALVVATVVVVVVAAGPKQNRVETRCAPASSSVAAVEDQSLGVVKMGMMGGVGYDQVDSKHC